MVPSLKSDSKLFASDAGTTHQCLCELLVFSLSPVSLCWSVLVLSRACFVQMGIGCLLAEDYLLNSLSKLLSIIKIQISYFCFDWVEHWYLIGGLLQEFLFILRNVGVLARPKVFLQALFLLHVTLNKHVDPLGLASVGLHTIFRDCHIFIWLV